MSVNPSVSAPLRACAVARLVLAFSLCIFQCATVWATDPDPESECEFQQPQDAMPGEEDACRIDVQGPVEDGISRTERTIIPVGNQFSMQVCSDWRTKLSQQFVASSVAFAQLRVSRPNFTDEHILAVSLVPTKTQPSLVFDWFSAVKNSWSLENPTHHLPPTPAITLPTQNCFGSDPSVASEYRFEIDADFLNVYRNTQLVFRRQISGYTWMGHGNATVTELLVDDLRPDGMPSWAVVHTLWRKPSSVPQN